MQLEKIETPEKIFSNYAYFSSFSESWLKHSKEYVEKMISRFKFNEKNFVVEIGSNDGYLLQHFVAHAGRNINLTLNPGQKCPVVVTLPPMRNPNLCLRSYAAIAVTGET